MSKTSSKNPDQKKPHAVSRKLKFLKASDSFSAAKTISKRPESKSITKKPPTKFHEFRLSHQKPKNSGRRIQLEDLYKTSEKKMNGAKR